MARLLFFALLFLVVFLLLKHFTRRRDRDDTGTPAPPPSANAADEAPVMVACAHCGVHLPRTETLPGPDGVYCSEAHRAAASRGAGDDR
jgi:uncharacterized protein